jgi:hypothetical protein
MRIDIVKTLKHFYAKNKILHNIQMDKVFLNVLKKLDKRKTLTIKDANKEVESTEKKFRDLVKQKMGEMKSTNLEEALKLLNTIYAKMFKNISTLDNYFTQDIRNIIHFRFPHVEGVQSKEYGLAKVLARLDPKVKGDLLKSQKTKANAKAENVVEIELNYVMDKIRDNITSDDPIRRAFALLLASGCRPIELFHLSKFEAIDEHWIKQDKVAKKRGVIVSVEKPIIYLTTTQFIAEVKKMRADAHKRFPSFVRTKETTVSRNNEKVSKTDELLLDSIVNAGNIIARQVFNNEDGMTLYTTKALYGAASYDIYGMLPNRLGNNLTQARWGELIYGHDGLMHNYSHFRIIHKNTSPTGLIAQIEVQQAKIDNIEDRIKQLDIEEMPKPSPELKTTITPKIKQQLDKIKAIYDKNMNITQTKMETLAKDLAPRSTIRLFFKKLKEQ